MASLTSGEMTNADWLRSTLVCPLKIQAMYESELPDHIFHGPVKVVQKKQKRRIVTDSDDEECGNGRCQKGTVIF